MTAAKIPEADFIALFEEHGPTKLARILETDLPSVYARRVRIEKKLGRQITGPDHKCRTRSNIQHPGRLEGTLQDGVILIASDCHYWNRAPSAAHRAFVQFCKDLKPAIVVMNGDVLDGASISRHPPISWEKQPALIEEIEACQERLNEIKAVSKDARLIWTLGNHDARFEVRLATVAPEYARVNGVHLHDHFPGFESAMSFWVNGDVVIKHRNKGGLHAVHNNTVQSGLSMVTGHLHSLKVTPWTDYTGTRFGVDTGCLADPWGPQFEYMEDGPRNWRSGFAVLTFENGRLMWPELCHALDPETVEFRGRSVAV